MKKHIALILVLVLAFPAVAQLKSAQSVVAQFLTLRGDGALADADSLPTGTVVVNGVDNGASVTVANVTTGEYKATVTLPALTAGDIVQLRANYTIDGIATGRIVPFHVGDTYRASDVYSSVSAGFPSNSHADAEPAGGIITTGSNTSNDADSTWLDNGTYWQTASVSPAVGGYGLFIYEVFSLGTSARASLVRVNAKETFTGSGAAGVCHVCAYNYITSAWDQLSDSSNAISGSSDANYTYILLKEHQSTAGETKIGFRTTNVSGHFLYLDQVLVETVSVSTGGATASDIANAVWTHPISTHDNHEAAGFYASRSMVEYGEITSAAGAVMTCDVSDGLRLLADVYNGLTAQLHDETNDLYEVRKIVDCTVNGADLDITLDRTPYSTISGDWDLYVLPNALSGDQGVTLAATQGLYAPSKAGDEMTADVTKIHGSALTETAGQLAAAFVKFFNVAAPTGTVNSIPDAVAGATGGLAIVGSKQDLVDAPNATAVTAFRTEMEKSGTYLKALYDVKPASAPPTLTELTSAFTEIKGAGWTTQTLAAIIAAIGSGGITAQQVRDALKLAPSAGAAAADSIDDKIGDVQTSADAAARPGDKMDWVDALNSTATTALIQAVWDKSYSGLTTAHSIGKALVTWLSTGGIPGTGI